jgi:hypothetical protein
LSYEYPEIRKFLGLFAQQNSFDVPDGAMERALNIVLNDDNVILKDRGFYQYFDPTSTTLNNLFFYKQKLLAVFTTKISYFTDTGSAPNVTGSITNLTGETIAVTSPRVSRSMEQNGNLYFTTDNGVMKIDDFDGKVFKAGSPPGLDIRGNFLPENGPIVGETQIGYRALFGRKDDNTNTVLGAPSDILVLTNSKKIGVSWTRTTNVVTVTSTLHNLSTGMTVVVSASTGAPAVTAGTYTITVTTPNAYTFAETAANSSGTLDYTATRVPLIEFTVPREITTSADNFFFQLYRTSMSNSSSVSPTVDFRLIEERILTSAELTAGFVSYQDEIDEVLVEFAPELYTNPNSREGESQANARPPKPEDITLFNNYAMFGNCITRHVLLDDVIDPSALVTTDYVEFKVDATTRRYVAATGVGNKTVRSDAITNAAGDLRIDYVAHGFSNGFKIYISTITGGALTEGAYFVVSAAADNFEISLTSGGASIAFNSETSLYFEGVTNGTYPIFQLDKTDPSVSTQLRNTAQGLVRAVNRDPQALIYGNYASGITDVPGKMRFTAVGFTGSIYMRANTTTAGSAFAPALPDSFASGTQVQSGNDVEQNVVYVSKIGEPEAVPILNKISVGSKNYAILRILALRDSVIILKADGVFKITGDSPTNFQATALDDTVIVVGASSAAKLNNQVYFLANQGICSATDSSVDIVSRRIENLVETIIGKDAIATETAAVGYESDRTYRISTIAPNDDVKTITYYHNTLNDTWTESDVLFKAGVVGPNNTLYLINYAGKLMKGRKYGNKLDWVGQNYAITVTSVASDGLSALVTSTTYVPMPGDVVLKSDVFSRIASVDTITGTTFRIYFRAVTNLAAADAVNLYAGITSNVRMAPFHAGRIGLTKQFAQLELSTRGPSVSRMAITFTGQTFGGSEETEWLSANVSQSGGWGEAPWGFFPYGQTDGIDNLYSTQPAPVIRLYVPQFQQRNTFIQTVMNHREGGEAIEVQAMTWSVRPYRERTSK